MLLVKTKVAPSAIAGLGLFADEDIPAGTQTRVFNKNIDTETKLSEIKLLPEVVQEYLLKYAYLENGKYILCGDDAKYTNHSENPNIKTENNVPETVALRDIKKGEEMTEDYRTFDADYLRKLKNNYSLNQAEEDLSNYVQEY